MFCPGLVPVVSNLLPKCFSHILKEKRLEKENNDHREQTQKQMRDYVASSPDPEGERARYTLHRMHKVYGRKYSIICWIPTAIMWIRTTYTKHLRSPFYLNHLVELGGLIILKTMVQQTLFILNKPYHLWAYRT